MIVDGFINQLSCRTAARLRTRSGQWNTPPAAVGRLSRSASSCGARAGVALGQLRPGDLSRDSLILELESPMGPMFFFPVQFQICFKALVKNSSVAEAPRSRRKSRTYSKMPGEQRWFWQVFGVNSGKIQEIIRICHNIHIFSKIILDYSISGYFRFHDTSATWYIHEDEA